MIERMPSTWTASRSMAVPKARLARIASLWGRVVAVDVEARIGLGVAQALRVRETLGEAEPLGLHAREDVIAGTVEDPVDAIDRIAAQRFA